MKDDPLYLHKNPHGVYHYRRPVVAEDQVFWLGLSGSPKKEWSRPLRTKDRRGAIACLADAADLYDAEREAQLERYRAQSLPESNLQTEREREEREAGEAKVAAQKARREARKELRVERRHRLQMSTAELSPEEAAWHDLVQESRVELEQLRAAVEGQRAANATIAVQGGAASQSRERPTIETLIAAYQADKSPGWSGSSKKAVVPVFRALQDMFAGQALQSICRQDARAFVSVLEALPTQIGKRREFAGLTVQEAVEKGRVLGLPTIKPKTINDGYIMHVAAMFNWAVKEQWILSTPFSGLNVHDPVDDSERRDPFTAEQLQTLFTQAPWNAPWAIGPEKPGSYWVPLLCLFHGLRNGEAAGLRVEDIDEEDGVPVLHVRPYDGRTVKTAGSRGTLPIHPELLRLGFLSHAAARRAVGELLLFPEGVANSRGQVGAKLAERFSNRVKRLGFEGRKLGMHSFRHNFEDRLRAAELAERTALALARRTESGSSRIYGEGLSARQKAAALAKVEYPGLHLDHLQPS
ncbi:site-specific integrase [Allopontixanthobacter sp.]|uniref:site-specific integrase n=1 Tax=Allopontixanthobacter sp. TaxID=2906452 RepID=UPI002AB83553|nr:site-specific integrase [Allopontixanthobacter sp.]MDZ4307177.1 site-specific integrase [Allopontixanthobacter sp.]